jgi:MarR family transcriptional regulator, organic hydroperoxide resistance regulator
MAMAVRAKTDPATEAWRLATQLWFGERPPRVPRIAAEFDISPMAIKMLHGLGPGQEVPMSALADQIGCDASNITGIVDRMETRGLIERRDSASDRRVKLIGLTDDGVELRNAVLERLFDPPEALLRLSAADQRALRDILRRAVNGDLGGAEG